MKSLVTSLIVVVALIGTWVGAATVVQAANSNPLDAACKGRGSSSAVCKDAADQGQTDPITDSLINTIILIVSGIAGIGAVVMMILGGAKLVTSGGDTQKVSAGKSQIYAGAIGTVVVIASYTIISYVVGQLIG